MTLQMAYCKQNLWGTLNLYSYGKSRSAIPKVPYGDCRRIEFNGSTVEPLIRRTLVRNEIVDHSDVVGASPVGAAPNTSSFST